MESIGEEVPKVSPGPAMPDPSTPCRRSIPETASRLFLGWPIHRAGGLQSSSSFLDTPCRTPLMGSVWLKSRPVFHWVSMNSLKYGYGPTCPTTLRPAGCYSLNGLKAVSGYVSAPLDTPCHTGLEWHMNEKTSTSLRIFDAGSTFC
jgi:hypothetical protein